MGGVIPLVYFIRKNTSILRLTKPYFNGRILIKALTNGSSELMTNVSMSLVNILYNMQLMRIDPENGVAAFGLHLYL